MSEKSESHSPLEAPNSIPWPPILYVLAVIIGYVAHQYMPLPWPGGMAGEWLFMTGILLAAMAIFIDVRTFLELRKHKTTILPTKGADHLVTSGPFSFSRNPIYFSNTLLVIALGLIFGNIWLIPASLAAAFATQTLAIKREERHLEARFGSQWRQYCKRVRRWI